MRILTISGSPRADGAAGLLLRSAARLASPDVEFSFYEGLLDLPHFHPDFDKPAAEVPASVLALRQQLAKADAVAIATPEYAYGMPGSLKNLLDWLVSSGSLSGKPVAALGVAPSAMGGEKAQASLVQTLTALNAVIVPASSFPVPFIRARLDASGSIIDPAFAQTLTEAVAALTAAAARLP